LPPTTIKVVRTGFRRRVERGEQLLVPLAGHSRGHTAVAVRAETTTGSGPQWLLHAGDAYFFHGEIDPVHPRTPPGLRLFQTVLAADGKARRHNQARLRGLAAEHGTQVEIFSAHDPQEMPSPLAGRRPALR
jgi:glyoxylase-like metal-dependent hydrolase (beta-lactamase superfamily II)